jgi:hypothetical protein
MSETNCTVPLQQHELTQLHTTTCLLMTRFINGQHCPKLANLIVQQLLNLLAHPDLEKAPANGTMYQQLLEHWQNISGVLLEQKITRRFHNQYYRNDSQA